MRPLPQIPTLFPYTTLFRSLDEMGITPVDLVVVNLYPFESRALDAPLTEAVELIDIRSEEHTSELQSHSELVCRLLLEKKNITMAMLGKSVYSRGNL